MTDIEKIENELKVQNKHMENLSREELRYAFRIQSLIQAQAELQIKIDQNERLLEEERRQADPKRHFIRWWGR